jgi:putative transposase
MALFGRSQRRICSLIGIQRSTYNYCPRQKNDEQLRQRLRELAQKHRRRGCPHLHRILRREKMVINHKRTERIYREENLSIRRKKRKKTTAELRVQIPDAQRPNQQWAMDFMSDALFNGRRIRLLTLIDEYSRECLAIEVDTSINGVRVTNVLNRVAVMRGLPDIIKVDNGPEFIGKALDAWAYQREVQLQFSRPGKPVDNRFVESFNGRLREECLNDNWFMSLQNARDIVEKWRLDYNTARPHSSLNDLTPQEFFDKEHQKLQLSLVQSMG